MTFPGTISVPDTSNIKLTYSKSLSAGLAILQKFVPKMPDGTVFDCTAATSVTMVMDNGQVVPFAQTANPSPVLGTHDATGIQVEIPDTWAAVIGSLGAPQGRYLLTMNDGVSDVVAAAGSYSTTQIS